MDQVYLHPDLFCAWHGPSFVAVNARGECGDGEPQSGYYFREARHLRTLRFEINGQQPFLCESAIHEPPSLSCTFVYPELTNFGGGGTSNSDGAVSHDPKGIPYRALDVRIRLTVSIGGLHAELLITNNALRQDAEFDLTWIVNADYADIMEVTSEGRQTAAPVSCTPGDKQLEFVRQDDQLPYRTIVRASGDSPWTASEDRLVSRVRLAPRSRLRSALDIEPVDPAGGITDAADRESHWRAWQDRFVRITIPPNTVAERIVRRNARDFASLALLEGSSDEWLTPQAAVPLYPAIFGRDALTATFQAVMLDRGDALRSTLTCLGRVQGTRDDAETDEQPGRIVQQMRRGPMARLGLLPFTRYYGDYASPLMYVIALAQLYAWTGDRADLEAHWDNARRVLDWAREYGDADHDGYLEYCTRSPKGPRNQGWKDSGDALVYDDATIVPTPAGTCELQGYWYGAQQFMAILSYIMGAHDDAKAHWHSAAALKERFNRDWWMDDEGFFALAMDPQKKLVRAVTSNPGHCLASGIVDEGHLPRMVGRLFQPDLFSGWGIRTLSSEHHAFDPIGYHRGSVWAVENATIAFGLRRFGFDARALDLTRGLFDLANLYPFGRVPEAVGGYARRDGETPGVYPRANAPQLWNTSAYAMLVQSVLGLQPVALLDTLVVDPVLPTWLPEIVLHNLRVGGATATIRFWRGRDGNSHAEVIHKRGTLHLIKQQPPESLSASWTDRFSALADRVLHH